MLWSPVRWEVVTDTVDQLVASREDCNAEQMQVEYMPSAGPASSAATNNYKGQEHRHLSSRKARPEPGSSFGTALIQYSTAL